MIDNATYNKIKLLHHVCELIWFIDKHAIADAKSAGDTDCIDMLTELRTKLEEHLMPLKKSLRCGEKNSNCECPQNCSCPTSS